MKKIILMLCCISTMVSAKTTTYLRPPEAPKQETVKDVPLAKADALPVAAKNVATKPLKIATTLPVLAALTRSIGGDRVEVTSLSSASEDPHFVKAKPTFKILLKDASLLITIGRGLELWVPQVVSSSGNQKLISGEGVITTSTNVAMLEVPSALNRSLGDIHPQGNPHIWLSPTAAVKMAETIKNALIKVDASSKDVFEKNYQTFKQELSVAMFGAELVKASGNVDFLWRLHEGQKLKSYVFEKKKPLGGWLKEALKIDYTFYTYHSELSYLAHDFQLKVTEQHVEEKPGVAPSLRYQNELITKAKQNGIKHVVAATYYAGNAKLIDSIVQGIGGNKLFIDVDCRDKESYIAMINRILGELVKFRGAVHILPKIIK